MDKFFGLPEEKQNSIIDAALSVFGSVGYKKASVSDIANAAGISKAMVFHYFGTKKALYIYLIHYCSDLIINAINTKFDKSITDFFDRIMQASDIKLSVLKLHPATLSFLSSVYFEEDSEVRDEIKVLLAQGDTFRSQIAFDGMDTTKFKEGVDAKLVFKMLVWMAEGFASTFGNLKNESLEEFYSEFYACMNLLKKNFYKQEYL